jgi:hypothetical protein
VSDDLINTLAELHRLVNNFSITGEGVSGNLKEGYAVDYDPVGAQPMDVPQGPEGPELPEQ